MALLQGRLFTVYLWSISKESDEFYLTRGRLQLILKASVMKGLTICHIRYTLSNAANIPDSRTRILTPVHK